MAKILDLTACDTNLDSTAYSSIHSNLETLSQKKFQKSYQRVSEWQITNVFTSENSDQINQSSDLPDTMCLNDSNSIIVIQDDDCSLQADGQTNQNVITVSDSESECFSLPDIEEPFDSYPSLTHPRTCLSLIVQEDVNAKGKYFSLNSTVSSAREPLSFPSCSKIKKHEDQNIICISEDSLDSDVIEITSGEEDFKDTLNDCKVITFEGSCKTPNGSLDNLCNNFIEDTNHCLYTNKNTNQDFSRHDLKQNIANGTLPLSTLRDSILPYSLQPYTSNMNLSDLKDQPDVTVELIQSCLEEGDKFALCTANISCLYLYAYRPAQSLLEDLLKWFLQRDVGFTLESGCLLRLPYFKLYGLLDELFYCYPENVSILWNAICERMLSIPLEGNVFLNFALTLEICLSVLEGEIFQLQDPKKCQIYHLGLNNESYSKIKKIIWWLGKLVVILNEKNLTLTEQVLCQLGKLLELGVAVSQRDAVLAKRIAKDLVGVYLSIPCVDFRQRFLSMIQSNLIRFKLLEILLEKYFSGTMLSWSYMPESIADIAKSFFQATPMKNDLLDDNIFISLDNLDNVTSSSFEELIMLIYFAIISYLAHIQGSFHNHSSDPPDSEWFYSVVDFEHVCNGCIPPPWGSLMNQLKDFPLYISQLNKHIRKFSVSLSKQTHLYLKMLNNLTDLMEDLKLSVF